MNQKTQTKIYNNINYNTKKTKNLTYALSYTNELSENLSTTYQNSIFQYVINQKIYS